MRSREMSRYRVDISKYMIMIYVHFIYAIHLLYVSPIITNSWYQEYFTVFLIIYVSLCFLVPQEVSSEISTAYLPIDICMYSKCYWSAKCIQLCLYESKNTEQSDSSWWYRISLVRYTAVHSIMAFNYQFWIIISIRFLFLFDVIKSIRITTADVLRIRSSLICNNEFSYSNRPWRLLWSVKFKSFYVLNSYYLIETNEA